MLMLTSSSIMLKPGLAARGDRQPLLASVWSDFMVSAETNLAATECQYSETTGH